MQLELLEITIVGLVFIPLVMLAILHLLNFQKGEGREKKTSIYGFLTFILMFVYFLFNWYIAVDVSIIVILYASALTFLPVWILSLSKPEYLDSWKIPFAIIFLALWGTYVGTRLLTTFVFVPYFAGIQFALSIIFLLLRFADDSKTIIIIIGLILLYLERAWSLFDVLIESIILVAGLWLVFIWFMLSRGKIGS